MIISIDWKEWHEGEAVTRAGEDNVFVCIYKSCGDRDIPVVYPHLVARCVNRTGKASDWECLLGRTRKRKRLVDINRPIETRRGSFDRKLFVPEKDKLFYTRETLFNLPPDTFPGGDGAKVFCLISDLFYYPDEVSDKAVPGFNL